MIVLSKFCCRIAKRDRSGKTDFGREIVLALIVKFCLLGILWWSFFAGQKIQLNESSVARMLLDSPVKH